jgi:hypothetical protein
MLRHARLGLVLAACATLAATPAAVVPSRLGPEDIGKRLRVFATPGDYKLANRDVTAVVRRQDGWLTELWRNRPRLPTTDQLGTLTDVDGIWQVHPVLYVSEKELYPVVAQRVAATPDGVESEGYARIGPTVYHVHTQYRLDAARSALELRTTFRLDSPAPAPSVGFGHAVKWGNVDYYLDGTPQPKLAHRGYARWIGRHGAGGDLLLRAANRRPLWLEYKGRIRGFQGTIYALAAAPGRALARAGKTLTVAHELSYEALPRPARLAPRATGLLTLDVRDESGRPLPAKVRVDRDGHPAPLFDAEGGLDGADRFMWTGNGKLERALEAGRYRLFVTSGIERAAATLNVQIAAGQTQPLTATLPRVLATPGFIAADLHLHQAPSVDADISLPARVVSVVAEGVELAVATDHYVVTDFAPTVRELRTQGVLSVDLSTISGTEVSTLGNRFGHFNVFPLTTGQNVRFRDTTPGELFADARRQVGSGVVQVNHPRLEPNLGYFTYFGIDDDTGRMSRPGFSSRFDTLEVYNGDDAHDMRLVRRVFVDWLHLLELGERWPATGSSDSHKLAFLDPGLPRTMIRHGSGGDDRSDVHAPISNVLRALKAGHSFVTSGPLLHASINGKSAGERASGVGRTPTLHVRVEAAPWIDVTELEVHAGGSGEPVARLRLKPIAGTLRYEGHVALAIQRSTFVVVAAHGERPLPNASRATRPFAFTNPIWVDP